MLTPRARVVDMGLRLGDLGALTAAFPLAYIVRDAMKQRFTGLYPIETYWPVLAVTLLLWLVVSWMTRVYDLRHARVFTELLRVARAMIAVACAMGLLGFLSQQHDISRLFVTLYVGFALVLLWANRLLIRSLARATARGENARRVAVVGCGELAREVVRSLGHHPEWAYEFAGFIADGPHPQALASRKILGDIEDLPRLLRTCVLDEVIFAMPMERLNAMDHGIRLCEEQGVSVRVCMSLLHQTTSKIAIDDSLELPMLAFTRIPSNGLALAGKRVFDVLFSALALLLAAPLFAVVAIAIWIDSPGPIFFRQRRVGTNGREFMFYKFRSMHEHAEEEREQLQGRNEATGPVFKIRRDPRITRVGAVLRRTSIDELPQLWNVLRGQMSVVGPRPPIPSEVKQYERWQRRRLSIKPGLTCLWQISGRSEIEFERWMRLDLHYIDNWSLWHDLKIVVKTIPAVLSGRGAQ